MNTEEVKQNLGKEATLAASAELPSIFHGMRVRILRVSQLSTVTAEVLEKRGCYRAGDTLHCKPCDLAQAT